MPANKIFVHIEAALQPQCQATLAQARALVSQYLSTNVSLYRNGPVELGQLESGEHISFYVSAIAVVDLQPHQSVSFWQAELCIHCFRMCDTEPDKDFLDGEDDLPAFEQWELPNSGLCGLWESVEAEEGVKARMLGYADTSVQFSEAGIDSNIISWNRMMLLHGPPGTGKTTTCKALAQKLFIRNSEAYTAGVLLDINAHSLFSKWFSESGKLVMKLFDHIAEIAEDSQTLVCVLVDEVESIATSRSYSSRSNEPGDAVRVVNSVLTSLDALRRQPNVLVLCTSNMAAGIDAAFLDRVDLKVYMGPPCSDAVFRILRSCLLELMRAGIITPAAAIPERMSDAVAAPLPLQAQANGQLQTPTPTAAAAVGWTGMDQDRDGDDSGSETTPSPTQGVDVASSADDHTDTSTGSASSRPFSLLLKTVQVCEGLSGRALRKLPLRAHAYHHMSAGAIMSLEAFLAALLATARDDALVKQKPEQDHEV